MRASPSTEEHGRSHKAADCAGQGDIRRSYREGFAHLAVLLHLGGARFFALQLLDSHIGRLRHLKAARVGTVGVRSSGHRWAGGPGHALLHSHVAGRNAARAGRGRQQRLCRHLRGGHQLLGALGLLGLGSHQRVLQRLGFRVFLLGLNRHLLESGLGQPI